MAEVQEKKASDNGVVAIINLSKFKRKFQAPGFVDKEGKQGPAIDILPDNKPVEVSALAAKHLLGLLPSGKPRYPELQDAAKFVPLTSKAAEERKALLAENKKLLEENEDLKKKLKEALEPKGKGGK